jgi:thioesterase domain-containing protein/acyl carrier protein
MDPILSDFDEVAAGIRYADLHLSLVSTLTGKPATSGELSRPAHWFRQMREPAQFAVGMASLAAEGCDIFVEIGPQAMLVDAGRESLGEDAGARGWLPSLRRDRVDGEQILESLADLYMRGVDPDWRGFHADGVYRRVALPTYPFKRERFGQKASGSTTSVAAVHGPAAERDVDWLEAAAAGARPVRAEMKTDASARRLEQLVESVRQHVAEIVARPAESLSVDQNCLDLGMDSLGVLDFVAAIRQTTGIVCTPDDFMDRPTIAGFAAHIDARSASARSVSGAPSSDARLVALNERGSRVPLFCMHPAGGRVGAYLRLRGLLGDDQPLYAVQSRALHSPDAEHATLESMAVEYATLVRSVRPEGPYRLLGWSMGGFIAHAVAFELERRGARVDMVGMVDVIVPRADSAPRPVSEEIALALTAIIAEVQPALAASGLTASDLEAARSVARGDLLAWCEARGRIPAAALSGEAFETRLGLYQRHFHLVREHRPATVTAPIVEWRASSLRRPYDWSKHSRAGATGKLVGGTHFSVMQSPHIDLIAADLEMDGLQFPVASFQAATGK